MPKSLQAKKLFEKALTSLQDKQLETAKKYCLKLTKFDKSNFSAWHLLAVIHVNLQDVIAAELAFNQALQLAPSIKEQTDILEQLGKQMMQTRQASKAIKYFSELTKLVPNRPDVIYFTAEAHRLNKEHKIALGLYEYGASKNNGQEKFFKGKGQCLAALGQINEALVVFNELHLNHKSKPEYIVLLADCYVELNDVDSAETLLKTGVALPNQEAYFSYKLALLYRDFGKLADAQSAFEKTLSLEPNAATVYYNYSRIKTFVVNDSYIAKMEKTLAAINNQASDKQIVKDKVELLFALGKVNEDIGQHQQAFNYWQAANKLKRSHFQYHIKDDQKRFELIKNIFSVEFLEKLTLPKVDNFTLIFIVGMPRAGSTLVEQILSSHSDIQGMGELTLLPELISAFEEMTNLPYPRTLKNIKEQQLVDMRNQYISAVSSKANREIIIDKLPGNFWLIGLINILFPNAIIVNAYRNPIDTCFSCFKHLFSGSQRFAYDLKEIKQYYELYQQVMEYWHSIIPEGIYDVEYEKLVAAPQETISTLLQACNLSWQDSCLDFHKAQKAVKTSSAAQVRVPLHANAVGKWRHYEDRLEDFREYISN
ncbi:MAG: tetratricopeptide (TPR) repeat protein [Alteromonadaceae bacterium]|jgi:tetratricopeptide (TPR) repeat protein